MGIGVDEFDKAAAAFAAPVGKITGVLFMVSVTRPRVPYACTRASLSCSPILGAVVLLSGRVRRRSLAVLFIVAFDGSVAPPIATFALGSLVWFPSLLVARCMIVLFALLSLGTRVAIGADSGAFVELSAVTIASLVRPAVVLAAAGLVWRSGSSSCSSSKVKEAALDWGGGGGDCGASGGGVSGGGASFDASSIASPPLGQKAHARHLHHMQWNFLNFVEQNAWHCAVAASVLYVEMHWLFPCSAVAVRTEPPCGNTENPRADMACWVRELVIPEVDTSRCDVFQFMKSTNAATAPAQSKLRDRRCCCVSAAATVESNDARELGVGALVTDSSLGELGVVEWRRALIHPTAGVRGVLPRVLVPGCRVPK